MSERESDMTEVHQVEAEEYPPIEVPVRIEGPADVRVLPAVAWVGNRCELSDTSGPIKLTSRNPHRKRLVLHSQSAGFFYGASQAQVAGRGACPFIENDIVIELLHTEEVWACNVATETPIVSVVEEMWIN
jgi:hypothetical protein